MAAQVMVEGEHTGYANYAAYRFRFTAPKLEVAALPAPRADSPGIVATAIFAMMLALTVFQTQLAQYQLEIDRADQAVEIARTRLIELQKQNAVLHSPERVTRAARQQGMVPADTDSYVTVSEQAIIEVARAAGDRLQGDNITSGPDPLAEHKRVKAIIAGATR